VGFLLSILVALGLMNKNNEVIALKSCGIGKNRLLKPTMVLGVLFCAGLFLVSEMLVPVLMVKANQIWLQEVRKKNIVASKTNDIWMRAARQIIHIKQYVPEEKRVAGITIHTFDENFRLIERVDAVAGVFIDGRWQLDDAVQQVFETDDGDQRITLRGTLAADIDLNPDDLAQAAKQSDEMGLAELGRYIQKVEREGYGATRYRVDYHGKIAAPFVCIFLSVLGAGIALRGNMREGMPVNITYGLGIAFLYWIFNSFCLSLGYAELMPAVIAAWLANLVFFSFSGFLLLVAN
jgi:lipopolysaccharide export system permease protein